MENFIRINKKINSFSKKINVEGDKSLSIRWVIISSLSKKKSIAYNLLKSEDVLSALDCIKTLGSKVKISKNETKESLTKKVLVQEHILYPKAILKIFNL